MCLVNKHKDECFTIENFLNEKVIEENIRNQKDIIGRSDIYKKENIDSSYPDYILNNILTFKDWII